MRVLLDINHPGQVHLFKHAARAWLARGDEVLFVARDKDVTIALLEEYSLPFERGPTRRRGVVGMLIELFSKTASLVGIGRRFRPHIVLSLGSPAAAWAAILLHVPHLAFEDTEHSTEQFVLYAPFTRWIATATCFRRELGRKQLRYAGYHELAYLHPARFTADAALPATLGLDPVERYVIVRFVSWEASHDRGHSGFSAAGKRRLVTLLAARARVIITSEQALPAELERYRLPTSAGRIHDLLAGAALYIGEGATMASEAAMLGVPSIYVNTLEAGTIDEQQSYGLVYHLPLEAAAIERALALLDDADARAEHQRRRARMLADKIDVTAWMLSTIDTLCPRPS